MSNIVKGNTITTDVIVQIVNKYVYADEQAKKSATDAVNNAIHAETDLDELSEIALSYSDVQQKKQMDIELNNNLENPTAFFTLDGDFVALDLVTHELRHAEIDGPIYPELHEIQPEVDQDWGNESTRFMFDDFTVVYTNNEVSTAINE